MTITLRNTTATGATNKGNTLTYSELDANFVDLLTNKLANISEDTTPQLGGALDAQSNNFTNVGTLNGHTIPGGTGTIALTSDISDSNTTYAISAETTSGGANLRLTDSSAGTDDVKIAQGTGITVTRTDANTITLASTVTAGISNLVEDTTPQLGGALDAQTNNFTNVGTINTHTIPGGTGTIALTSDIIDTQIVGGTDITVTQPDSSGAFTVAFSGSAGIASLANDTTPQLGGSLDVNGNAIVSTSNANINLNPDGSGKVRINNTYTLPNADGSNGQALTTDGAGTLSFTTISSGGLSNIVEDTSPQLGGNLDMNGSQIVTTSNANIKLYPNGTGVVEIGGDGSSADGTIQLNCSQNSHGIKLASPPHSAAQSYTITFPSTAPGANKIFQTDANGDLSFVDMPTGLSNISEDTTPQLGGNLDVNGQSIVSASNQDINITPNGSGKVVIDGLNYPTTDGSNGQVMTTDGAGNITFTTVSSGGGGLSNISEDTTPQLGGNLDVNSQDIVSTSNGNIDIQPNGSGKTNLKNITFNENIHDIGTTSGTKTPDINDGPVQTITLDGDLTLNAFASPQTGQSLTLIITQDGTGGRTLSSTFKFAGGTKTLSTAASAIDIMTVFYDGSNYWASLSTNFS
jgi:hypothetical protein